MLSRTFGLLLVACLVTSSVWAANDPDTFTFGPGQVDTIVADGSDQPALQGTTLSVTVEGPTTGRSCAR